MAIESAFDYLEELLVLTAGIDDVPGELTADEHPAIARAVQKRRREFVAGRALARRGLRSFGLEGVSIPVSERRFPVWPDGIVGSISHTRDLVGVALGRQRDYAGIGLDLEARNAVAQNLFHSILVDSEARGLSSGLREEEATVIFSCKEAVFKAVNPLVGEFLDFLDVLIELRDGAFVARCRNSLRSAEVINGARGYFEIKGDSVRSVFVIDATTAGLTGGDRARTQG